MITVPIIDDTLVEFDETFSVTLSNPTGGATLGTLTTSTVTILDNDLPPTAGVFTIAPAALSILENGGSATLVVNRSGGSSGAVSVAFATANGTATAGSDYTANSGILSFADGQTSSTISVLITDDTLVEFDETFTVTLSNPTGGAALGTTTVSTVTILDNDFPGIQGHVYCDSNGNGIENIGEASVGATVFVDLNQNNVLDAIEPSTTTDGSGNYVFASVVSGASTVVLVVPNGCRGIPQSLPVIGDLLEGGFLAREVELADADNDGDDDVWLINDLSHDVTIFVNDGGSFTTTRTISFPFPNGRPQAIDVWQPSIGPAIVAVAVVGDSPTTANGLTRPGQGAVYEVIGGQVTNTIPMGDGPIDVAIDDFDGDMLPDFVTANFRSSDVYLYLSTTKTTAKIADASVAMSVTAGDFDNDGNRDIALVGYGSAEVQVLLGDGEGAFPRKFVQPSFSSLISVGAVNLDGLGGDELIVLGYDGDLAILSAGPSGVSQLSQTQLGARTTKFEVGDLNRDGVLDLVVIRPGSALMDFLVGNGLGGFTFVGQSNEAATPVDVIFTDIDGDMVDDLVIANVFGNLPNSSYALPSDVSFLKLNVVVTAIVAQRADFAPIAFKHLDVNRDNRVTALDALQVINAMTRISGGEGESVTVTLPSATDVNGDGRTSALDALMIINYMSREPAAEGLQVRVDDIMSNDDEDRITAIDLVLTQYLV